MQRSLQALVLQIRDQDRTANESPLRNDTAADVMISAMRLLLATSGLLVVWLDPVEPAQFVPFSYGLLIAYVAYSWIVYALTTRHVLRLAFGTRWSYWVDLCWVTVLIAFSGGTQSLFSFGFLFAILVAGFRGGFKAGVQITLASFLLSVTVGYVARPPDSFELNRFLLRPTYLLVIGYMVSYWGGFQASLLQRLSLLKEVTQFSNPRFGVDERTVANALRRLRSFYDADLCVVVTPLDGSDRVLLTRVGRDDGEPVSEAAEVPRSAVAPLLSFPEAGAIFQDAPRRLPWQRITSKGWNDAADVSEEQLVGVLELLEARSYLTVPWRPRQQGGGRLYIAFNQPRRLDRSDLDFLHQFVDQLMPAIENVRLVDRLATDAAEAERQRIARDLHDSVVQSYIGLRIGLDAVREKLADADAAAAGIAILDRMLGLEIDQLRRYLSGLKTSGEVHDAFLGCVRRFSHRFSDATGIQIQLDLPESLRLNDRLAAEVFQLVVEALSNVRRHTDSTVVRLKVETTASSLKVEVEDGGVGGQPIPPFMPRSISERVAALGGQLRADGQALGGTRLAIDIPL